ncbi:unnamed protein product [Ceutorhynchus assimilis]|uniref:Uncharacterized protein n=1 Tax=Ceutorhynchus assimilis TaxID=467358 RepID=A0A9N9QMT5_9CUCU|nr:unnamed protein product [Ceutorhynchus assimilis]
MVLQANNNNSKKKMEKKSSNDVDTTENINIIRKIIDDFENQAKTDKKLKKKLRNRIISTSDSTLSHKECRHPKRSQVSPKPSHSLRGSLMYRLNNCTTRYYDPWNENDNAFSDKTVGNNVYINFMENCDNENTEGNRFVQDAEYVCLQGGYRFQSLY